MTAPPESIQERYATIERLYSEREYPQVEALSEALLLDLTDSPNDPVRQRVMLLLGHTRLYGMGDPAGAEGYYSALLRSEAELMLRQIAEQGLEQCQAASSPPPMAGEATGLPDQETLETQSAGTEPPEGQTFPITPTAPAAEDAAAATPWLEPAAFDVVEEPDQIEVAMADPERRDDIEVKELSHLPADSEALDSQWAMTNDPGSGVDTIQPSISEEASSGLSAGDLAELSRGLLGVVLR